MESYVIIISNTFPVSGETFLKTELDVMPKGINYSIFPFFKQCNKQELANDKAENIYVYNSNEPIITKIKAFLLSFKNLFEKREIIDVIRKRGRIRNAAKAIKFAYISELRVQAIKQLVIKEHAEKRLIFYSYWMYEVGYVGARLKEEFPNSKFITRCHGYDLYAERHLNGYLPYRKYIFESADMICPISKQGKEYISKLYGDKYDNKIIVSRLGTSRSFIINKKNEENDIMTFVSCSNLIPLKRVELIIKAFANIKDEIRWVHFGDGELRRKLELEAKQLPQNVHTSFRGFVPNLIVQEFYATHKITAFINVSETEGIPVSIMEAQSYGIPVIATNVGGTHEIVFDGKNGVLLKKDFEITELLTAISQVIEMYDKYSAESINTWNCMSNASVTTRKFYELLTTLEE